MIHPISLFQVMRLASLVSVVAFLSVSAHADLSTIDLTRLKEMSVELHQKGASTFVSLHPACTGGETWGLVAVAIKHGNDAGLEIGIKAMPYLDAGCGESMVISLGQAIKHNAAAFLKYLSQRASFGPGPEEICGAIVPNDSKDYVPEDDINDLSARLKALSKVKNKELQLLNETCSKHIRKQITSLRTGSAKGK